MGFLSWIVGSSLGRLVATVFLAGLILFGTTQYIRLDEKDKLQRDQLQQQIETRKRVDDAVRNSPSDVDDAIEFLRDRQRPD